VSVPTKRSVREQGARCPERHGGCRASRDQHCSFSQGREQDGTSSWVAGSQALPPLCISNEVNNATARCKTSKTSNCNCRAAVQGSRASNETNDRSYAHRIASLSMRCTFARRSRQTSICHQLPQCWGAGRLSSTAQSQPLSDWASCSRCVWRRRGPHIPGALSLVVSVIVGSRGGEEKGTLVQAQSWRSGVVLACRCTLEPAFPSRSAPPYRFLSGARRGSALRGPFPSPLSFLPLLPQDSLTHLDLSPKTQDERPPANLRTPRHPLCSFHDSNSLLPAPIQQLQHLRLRPGSRDPCFGTQR